MKTRHRTLKPSKLLAVTFSAKTKTSLRAKKYLESPCTSKSGKILRKRFLDPSESKKPGAHRTNQYKKARTQNSDTEFVANVVDDPKGSSGSGGLLVQNSKGDLVEMKEAQRREMILFINVKVSLEYNVNEKKRACSAWSAAREKETYSGTKKNLEKGVCWPLLLPKPCPSEQPMRNNNQKPIVQDSDFKFVCLHKNGGRAVELIAPIMMDAVTPDPQMTYWSETTMNYRVEDGKFLVHYPYLGENVCDQDFEYELWESYGKVDHKSLKQTTTTMPDEVFFQTVTRYEKQILQGQNHSQQSVNLKTSDIDLTRQDKCGQSIPSRFIFTDIATTFPFLGFPFELERRFARIQRELSDHNMIDPTGTKSNEGLKLAVAVGIKKDKPRNEKHFCRRCLLYCCNTHDEDDHVDTKYINTTKSKEPLTAIKCRHADCVKISVPENAQKNLRSNWTPAEMSLCKVLMEMSKEAYCHMSSILTTKTCREVYNFCNSEMGRLPQEYEYKNESPQKKSSDKPSTSTSHSVTRDNKTTNVAQQARIKILRSGKPKFIPKNWSSGEDCPRYIPCLHSDGGYCDEKSNCSCFNSGSHCEKYCSCAADCIRRFKGCRCKNDCSDIACPCYKANRECDPSLCRQCGSENVTPVDGKCKNVAILYQWEKEIELKKSNVAGWGGFTPCDIKKYELIAEYRGELISSEEGARRALIYDKIQHTYLFSLNEDLVVDATRVGNKVRFLNSSTKPNCIPKLLMVNGDHRIGIYANKNIKAGEELFFDYQHVIHDTVKKKKKGKKKAA